MSAPEMAREQSEASASGAHGNRQTAGKRAGRKVWLRPVPAKSASGRHRLPAKDQEALGVLRRWRRRRTETQQAFGARLSFFHSVHKHLSHLPFSRVLQPFSSMSVRYKIAATLIVGLALAIASLGMVTFAHQKRLLQQEAQKRAAVLVQQLANIGKEALLTKQELLAYATIKDFQAHAGVVYGMIVDNQGHVFVHHALEEKGRVLEEKFDRLARQAEGLLFRQIMWQGEPVLEAVLPITMKADGLKIGVARIGVSQRELIDSIRQQQLVFFWISILFVGLGLLLSFGLANVLTWPIYILAVGMQEAAQGDLSQQVKIYYRDEIGRLTEVFNQMIVSLREKLHMEQYLSNTALKSIKEHRGTGRLKLGGESKCVTALFSDVRGFTTMAEQMSPEEVVAVLNIYLNLQGRVVHQHHGVVDKFVGDAVMAIFEGPGQELHAIRAAVEIQHYIQTLNWARAHTGQPQMQVGIGVNGGTVIMGNMGSEEMMNYTVIGDTINVAARLSGVAEPGQVIISKRVADAMHQDAILGQLDPVTVKGKEKPLDIYEVLALHGANRQGMRRAIDVPAVYRLAGLDESHHATVYNIGAFGCLLEARTPLGIGTMLRLDIAERSLNLRQAQAVVKHVCKQGTRYYMGVYFANISEQDKSRLVEWVHRIETESVPAPLV